NSRQGPIAALQPAHGALMAAQTLLGEGNDSRQSVKTVGFKSRQPSTTSATLQAPGGEIQCFCQFFEGEAGEVHQLIQNRVWKTFPDSLTKVGVGR
ncbi:MAG TPA: hypothetical protein VHW45_03835, partial [Candidatus Sulfotelmatobacter sp.]|nr:hypothetical protein [Candidatus Sulfotelmatobacter sp.]